MINDQVLLALIVAVPAVIAGAVSPVIMLTLTGRRDREAKKAEAAVLAEAKRVEEENRRYDKEEVHAREDAVARRAAENAQKMLERQDVLATKATEAAEVLALNTELAAKNADEIKGQVRQIHTLVNSSLTYEKAERLKATKRWLLSQHELVDLKVSLNIKVDPDTLAEMNATKIEIDALEIEMADRIKTTDIAAAEAKDATQRAFSLPPSRP